MTGACPNRWNDAMLEHGAGLRDFWLHHLAEKKRSVLFILAKGFDPRMCIGLEQMLALRDKDPVDVALIEFDEGPNSPSRAYLDFVAENVRRLERGMNGQGSIRRFPILTRSVDGRRIASQSALHLVRKLDELGDYTDIVVDISAGPRGVFLPLIAKLLHLVDEAKRKGRTPPVNLHVMVSEDSDLDARIQDEGVEERADYIAPFKGGMDREASAGQPKVWIPLLGENQRIQLERIHDLVTPDEISPVLPSPARDPRRADNLVCDYHRLLFDNWRIEPRNFIYGSERNPFEVYRQITRAICSYRESFDPLGGAKFILSALSSKLLSIGALLVAYDFKTAGAEIGIAHVDCQGYKIEPSEATESELSGLWLTGECDAVGLSGNSSSGRTTKDGAPGGIESTA
jgi:hypothetical protein